MRSMLVRQRCVPFNSQYVRTLRRNVSTLTEGSVDRSLGPSEQKPSTQGKQNVELTLSSPYKLKLEDYCLYRDTQAPRPSQLEYADHFFAATKHSPVHLWASSQFRTIPVSLLPEVAFIGRSNVGKSSIINALVGEDICASSSKPGRTRTITSIGVGGTKGGGSKIALVDTPGYGKGSHTEWGQEIQKYLEKRKQLRRIILLIDAAVGIKARDYDVLSFLRNFAIPYQLVLTKLDHALSLDESTNKRKTKNYASDVAQFSQTAKDILASAQPANPIFDGPGPLGDVIACSMRMQSKKHKKSPTGLSALRWAILLATGFDQIPTNFKPKR